MTPLLCIDGASIAPSTSTQTVLKGISLTLGRGEALAICGPSGIGKSTLLKAIAGEGDLRAGSIQVSGQSPPTMAPAQRARIGLISQSHDLVEQLRVDRNVMAGALGQWGVWRAIRYLAWARKDEDEMAHKALCAVGLADMASRATQSLSGGERQRVAIARALIQAPDLLLADEPVASLDPDNARAILRLLVNLARQQGMGLICSIHQPELAADFFDRVLLIEAGTFRTTP